MPGSRFGIASKRAPVPRNATGRAGRLGALSQTYLARAFTRPGTTIAGNEELESSAGPIPRLEGIDGKGNDLSRILALSDGVFGFALTFLAITLVLPATLKGESLPALPQYLRSLQTAFLGYILSFLIIAAWWNVHHRLFSSFVRYDPTLVRLNSYFLLIVSVNPFLVSLLFAYGPNDFGASSLSAQLAVAIYGAVEALGGATLFAIWRHATRGHRLVTPALPATWIRSTERNLLFNLGTFAVSIGVAFVSPLAAELVWIAMIFGISHRILRAPRHPPGHGPPAAGHGPPTPSAGKDGR